LNHRHSFAVTLNFHNLPSLDHPVQDALAFVRQFRSRHYHNSKIPILAILANLFLSGDCVIESVCILILLLRKPDMPEIVGGGVQRLK
jgi:hypothetical protein